MPPSSSCPQSLHPLPEFRRIVLAWNQSEEALHAARAAMPLMIAADLVNVVVIDPPGAWSGTLGPPADLLTTMLARQGVKAEVAVIASAGAGIAHTLQRHMRDKAGDLLVMGAYSHSRLRQAILGGTTRSFAGRHHNTDLHDALTSAARVSRPAAPVPTGQGFWHRARTGPIAGRLAPDLTASARRIRAAWPYPPAANRADTGAPVHCHRPKAPLARHLATGAEAAWPKHAPQRKRLTQRRVLQKHVLFIGKAQHNHSRPTGQSPACCASCPDWRDLRAYSGWFVANTRPGLP